MHRDTLLAMVHDANPNVFNSQAELTSFLGANQAGFPPVGDGVYWSRGEELLQVLRDNPGPSSMVELGRFYWDVLGDDVSAEAAYAEALCRQITNVAAHRGLAEVLVAQKRWDDVSGVLDWLRRGQPGNVKVLTWSAKCAESQQRWEDAVDHWSALTRLAPGDPRFWLRLATAAVQDDDGDLADAAVSQVLELDEEEPAAYILKARLAFDRGDMETAMASLTSALNLDIRLVAESCPGALLDEFLATADDAERWMSELRQHLRYE